MAVWINEFHYDNAGVDTGEFVELAGSAGTDLAGYSLELLNGNGGLRYALFPLDGLIIDDEGDGYGAVSVATPDIQNGAPDGLALVDPMGTVIEFLSYEGFFTATDGETNGLTSTDVGVAEDSNTAIGQSLQLSGTGFEAADFIWSGPSEASPGTINASQRFAAPAAFDLQITEIWPGNEPGGNLTPDWFEVTNVGSVAWLAAADGDVFFDDESADPGEASVLSGVTSLAPGETAVFVDDGDAGRTEFLDVWSPVITLDPAKVGFYDGSGLSQGGDGVTLFLDTAGDGVDASDQIDFEAYPDASANGGQSYDVELGAFSTVGQDGAVSTLTLNDENQPAVGSPGDGAPIDNPPQYSIGDGAAFEGDDGEANVIRHTVVRTEDSNEASVVYGLSITNLTADASDFAADAPLNGVVEFAAGQSEAFIDIEIAGDAAAEANETYVLNLLFTTDGEIDDAVGVGVIRNDDGFDAPEASQEGALSEIGSIGGLAGAEISAFDPLSQRLFITSGDGLEVLDISDPTMPSMVGSIDPSASGASDPAVTSVAVSNGLLAAAVPGEDEQAPGSVFFYNAATSAFLGSVTVGALPDMVTFTPDGTTILVANEGEPDDGINPEGSVSVISGADTILANGDTSGATVSNADFTAFDGQEAALADEGVRLFPGVSVSEDVEPEFITVSADSTTAYVALQEANTLAVVDVATASVTDLLPLGTKDHSLAGNEIDPSDEDLGIELQTAPVKGLYMPDAIATFAVDGMDFIVTANEGDARDADARISEVTLDPAQFPNASALQADDALGRLEISTIDGDTDGDGDFDELFAYGARSFSIWDASGKLVYDSGSDLARIVANETVELFNANDADPAEFDQRSDNKGVEPEGVVVGEIDGVPYAFIGLERPGHIVMFDVSDPTDPVYVDTINPDGNVAPEGLVFINETDSPNSNPLLAITYEDSNTLRLVEVNVSESTPGTILDIAAGNDNFDLLVAGLEAAGLETTVDDPNADLTVFAPTDDAIIATAEDFGIMTAGLSEDELIAGLTEALTDLTGSEDAALELLGAVLLYHVSPGSQTLSEIQASGTIATANPDGATFEVDGTTLQDNDDTVADPQFIDGLTDIAASNGVIQAIDRVLLPIDVLGDDDVSGTFTLELLHVTDQEANASTIDNIDNLSAVLNSLRNEDLGDDGLVDNTLTLSSGDAIIPGLFFDASEAVFGAAGIADIQIQNELGFEAIALGNHEFDEGTEFLASLIDGSAGEGNEEAPFGNFSALTESSLAGEDFTGTAFPYLATNLDFSTDPFLAPLEVAGGQAPQSNVVTSSTVINENGEDIGVIGLTTPTIDTSSSAGDDIGIFPDPFDDNPTDEQLDALAAEVQAEVDALLAANADLNKIILLSHMQQISIEQALAERLVDVDIIVAGGSNTRLFDENDRIRPGDSNQGEYPQFFTNAGGTTTALVNTDAQYKYVGRLVIDFDADGNIIQESYDPDVSGAFATDDIGVFEAAARSDETVLMSEDQEVGVVPPDTAAEGSIEIVSFDPATGEVTIEGTFSGLTDANPDNELFKVGPDQDAEGNPQSAIHLHAAAAGENGAIIRNFTVTDNGDGSGSFSGTFTLTDSELDGFVSGDTYVNLHTTDFMSGQLRGQVDFSSLVDPEVDAITDAIQAQIVATESNVFGVSDVFLNGNRAGTDDPENLDGVRTQETNLGNLTADANLAYANEIVAEEGLGDPAVISIKNGGGIRASIGEIVVPAGATEAVRVPNSPVVDENGNVVKPEGGISQNDIASVLAFNNGLTLLDITRAELVDYLEGAVSGLPESDGGFPQVAGLKFSIDPDMPAGERVISAAIFDENDNLVAELVRDGELVGDPNEPFRMVTLDFLAGNVFSDLSNPNRVDLTDLNDDDTPDGVQTGAATFADDGSEQDALAEFLNDNFNPANGGTPFSDPDVSRVEDARIQNLNFREDTVLPDTGPGTILDIAAGNDNFDLLVAGLEAAGLETTVDDPNADLTVFAPTDDAIIATAEDFGIMTAGLSEDELIAELTEALTDLTGSEDAALELLGAVLLYHVSPGSQTLSEIQASGTIATANPDGATFEVDGTTLQDNDDTVADPQFIDGLTDIAASNGVIQAIDRVLLPIDVLGDDDVSGTFTLELLHVADQEASTGAIIDAPNLSAVLNALEMQDLGGDGVEDNTIRLSSGDAFIPGVFFNASEAVFGAAGIADIQIQNELGLQAIALGNHEFDEGTEFLASLIDGSAGEGNEEAPFGNFSALTESSLAGEDFTGTDFPYLSTNLDFSSDPALAPLEVPGGQAPQGNAVTSSVVIEENGEPIGVVGATTPRLASISSPGQVGIAPIPFDSNPTDAQLDALAAEIQLEVDALLAANPSLNKVILLAHMQQLSIELKLAERLVDVDIIVAGGSNTRLFDDNDRPRDGDSDQGQYPQFVENAGGTTTAVVNTDGSYKYVGRLVLDFDANGNIIPESYDPEVSGAFATDAQGVADLSAEGLIDSEIQAIADAIEAQIIATESNVFGVSEVFLNGNRSGTFEPTETDGVRTQETNLGNLTADANLAYAEELTGTDIALSLKNGGGIRASIGETIVPAGGTEAVRSPNPALFDGDGNLIKPEGGISQNDIATTLAFNNNLVILTLTVDEIVALLEHGVSALPDVDGQFPQVAGVEFTFDPDAEEGEQIEDAVLVDDEGNPTVQLVRDGEIQNPEMTYDVLTLGFLAAPRFDENGNFTGGGDGYPFPNTNTDPNVGEVGPDAARVNLRELDDGSFTETDGMADFADTGTEQDALAEYLNDNFNPDNGGTPFSQEDTPFIEDDRIVNLNFQPDAEREVEDDTAQIVINEIIVSTAGTDTEFVEFLGTPGADISNLTLLEVESGGEIDSVIALDGTLGDNGYYLVTSPEAEAQLGVIGNAMIANNTFTNSSQTYILVRDFTGASGDDLDADDDGVIDNMAFGEIVDSIALIEADNPIVYSQNVIGPDGSFLAPGAFRDPELTGDFEIASFNDFDSFTPTAGTFDLGEPEFVFIHEVQGSTNLADGTLIGVPGAADESPLLGELVEIEGIVTQVLPDLGGYYVQEEDSDVDSDPFSSEGIFVSGDTAGVSEGARYQVTGTVAEVDGETTLIASEATDTSAQGNVGSVTPTTVTFPTATVLEDADGDFVANLEAFEGMLVNVPTELFVTELFQLDRFGTIRVSSGDRLTQFTQENAPSVPGFEQHLMDIAARSLVLDDGSDVQNPDTILVPDLGADGTLDAGDVFRMGNSYTDLTGVVSFSEDDESGSEEPEYRIHLPEATLQQNNARPTAQETQDPFDGLFTVAAFNIANFFTTLDEFPSVGEGTGPNGEPPRGADANPQAARGTPAPTDEFDRQLAKLVEALAFIDSDVVGLVELENDFLVGGQAPTGTGTVIGSGVAIDELVDAVNAELAGARVYDWVMPSTGEFVGTDVISTGFIYDTLTTDLLGNSAVLDTMAFVDPLGTGEQRNRPALAQTFTEVASGESFTAAVNHLKSKGDSGLDANDDGIPDDPTNPDSDMFDGQAYWNATRTQAAQELADWLASDPTGTGEEDLLVLGDLNAYAMEDPIQALEAAGFTDLAGAFIDDPYTFVFDGQQGQLDYALANGSLLGQVEAVVEAHINADEPDAFDYNLEFNRDPSLFSENPYRSSDHDPVIVGLELGEDDTMVVVGTDGDDELIGTDADEEFLAGDGDDFVFGAGGNDTVNGENGNDDLSGGAGDDEVVGGDGDDMVVSSEGDDLLTGGESGSSTTSLGGRMNTADNNVFVFDPEVEPRNTVITDFDVNSGNEAFFDVLELGDDLTLSTEQDFVALVEDLTSGENADDGAFRFGDDLVLAFEGVEADQITNSLTMRDFFLDDDINLASFENVGLTTLSTDPLLG